MSEIKDRKDAKYPKAQCPANQPHHSAPRQELVAHRDELKSPFEGGAEVIC
jgi:hypothetical protein